MDEKHPSDERIGRAVDERDWPRVELLLAMGLVIEADLFIWMSSPWLLELTFSAGLLRDA